MKKRIEIQLIILLVCGLVFAASWIGIQVARNNVGVWNESAELHFTTKNLTGLAPRSELLCAGMVVGHVRKITPVMKDGRPFFTLTAGVRNEFVSWPFNKRTASIDRPFFTTVLSPSSIVLDAGNSTDPVFATKPKPGAPPPELALAAPKKSMQDVVDEVVAKVNEVGEKANRLIASAEELVEPFIAKENGGPSTVKKFAADLTATSSIIREAADELNAAVKATTAYLKGESHLEGVDPKKLPPIPRILASFESSLNSLNDIIGNIDKEIGKEAHEDSLIGGLKKLVKRTNDFEIGLEETRRKLNGLIDKLDASAADMRGKIQRMGDTFVGRMLIKPEKKTATAPTPTPAGPARKKP